MKVLYFNHCTSMYGASKSLYQLVKELKDCYGIEPIVITPEDGILNQELNAIGIRNYRFKFCWWAYRNNYFNKDELNEKYRRYKGMNKQTVDEIVEFFRDEEIDIIHSNSSTIDIGAYVAKKLNIPHIWHIRELLYEHYDMRFYDNYVDVCKKIESMSSKIVCISNVVKSKYRDNISNSKLEVIYNGIKNQVNHEIIKNKSEFSIAFAGTISKDKNQFELIRALDILVNDKGYNDIKVYFLGDGDKNYKSEINEFINIKKLNNNIKFCGYVKDIMNAVKKCHLGVVCSRFEAFGRVTVEYMMNGLITVASNTGANEELIDNNIDGFIYKFNDYNDLSNKIEYIYNNYDNLEYMGKNAEEKALNKFTSDVNTKSIYKLYRNVLS